MDAPTKTAALLTKNDDLHFILSKAKKIADLQKKFQAHLDENLRKYCQVANILNHQLTVLCSNASIATFLRFKKLEILSSFHQDADLKPIQDILIKVQPNLHTVVPVVKPKPAVKLSPAAAEQLINTAATITDPKLKQALLNLAKNTR